MDINGLLELVADDSQAGTELDYDQRFISLEAEMQGQPEQQYGDTVIQAVEPDWTKVARDSRELLGQSKDFRLAVMLCRALTRTEGVPGALKGMQLLLAMTERFWNSGFPALEFDGEEDLLPRSNALSGLVSASGLLKDLRDISIHSRKLGSITLGVLERIQLSREVPEDIALKRENIRDFLQDELSDGNPDIASLAELAVLVDALADQVDGKMETELLPDFGALRGFLDCFAFERSSVECEKLGSASIAASQEAAESDSTRAAFKRDPGPFSREDAITMLDQVCAYLEKTEPANPAPLLIRRARGMIGKDFISILKEIAPDGLHQAELVAGVSIQN